MPQTSDPARELTELCDRLVQNDSQERGDAFLANRFGVEVWSPDFHMIIATILERLEALVLIVRELDYDEDHRSEVISNIRLVENAFKFDSLANEWRLRGTQQLGPVNVQPIKMLSLPVRQKISFPKLSEEEVKEILALVEQLQKWLTEQQLSEHDFIRQAILDGLVQFRFRLERIGWVGWGYTIESLREVIAAYFALQGAPGDAVSNPDAEAVLKRVAGFLRAFSDKTGWAKDVSEKGEFLLKAYGAARIGIDGASGVIGFLTHGG